MAWSRYRELCDDGVPRKAASACAWAWRAELLAEVERIRAMAGPYRPAPNAADPLPDDGAQSAPRSNRCATVGDVVER